LTTVTDPNPPADAHASASAGDPPVLTANTPLVPGRHLGRDGRYQIVRLLGKGGFGEAFVAYDTMLNRSCVVKRLVLAERWSDATRQAAQRQFEREARLLVSLNTPGHPHIPEIFEYLPDARCLIMKYIVGRDLRTVLHEQNGRVPLPDALRYIRDACDALVYMHTRQPDPVLHRDIKPSNILLDIEQRIWLIDFGLARGTVAPALRGYDVSLAAGTPGFAAPEQWQSAAEPRSDVYALAATLHHLVTGFVPSQSELQALLSGVTARPLLRDFLPDVDPLLEEFMSNATAFDPALRPTAAEALAIIETLIERGSVPEPPQPATAPDQEVFVGREALLEDLQQRLEHDGVLRITGMAGIGKTALAAALTRRMSPPDHCFWHVFHAGDAVETVFWALGAFLAHRGKPGLWEMLAGRHQAATALPAEMLVDYLLQLLEGEHLLLCFDDVQCVAANPTVQRLFARFASLPRSAVRIILVEREPGAILPSVPAVPLAGLDTHATQQLLKRQGIALTGTESAQLAHDTGGNPQLMLLAGDTLRGSTAAERTTRIARLAGQSGLHQFLLNQVYAGLLPDERAILQALAVLAGYGGTRAAIESVLDDDRPLDAINRLVARGLLTTSRGAVGTVYDAHAIVREFVSAGLSQRRSRHLHTQAARYYEQEAVDLLRAARHYAWAGSAARAVALLEDRITMLVNTGNAQAIVGFLEHLLAAADDPTSGHGQQLDADHRLRLHLALAMSQAFLGNVESASTAFTAALERLALTEDSPDMRRRRIAVYRGMGDLLEFADPAAALDWLQRGLALLTEADTLERLRITQRIGTIKAHLGDVRTARTLLHDCLAGLPPAQEAIRADIHLNLGFIYCRMGDLSEGRRYFQAALPLYQRQHHRAAIAAIRQNLSQISEMLGDWATAEREYHQTLAIAEEIGAAIRQIDIRLALGILATNRGNFAAAYAHLEHSLDLARRHASRVSQVYILASLADLAIRDGQFAQAVQMLDAAEPLALELAERSQLPEILRCRARIALEYDTPAQARTLVLSAIAVAREVEDAAAEGLGLAVLGQILTTEQCHTEAANAFAQSITRFDAAESPYELARCRLAWGQALPLTPANADHRRELLQSAQAIFVRLGAHRDQAAAEAALSET
jgi:tRNA A-37 threonylcarbamoyl transferase component Bud32/tetratricopeptide (TPR) repeat protein